MSTRATYRFINKEENRNFSFNTTVYIHHDGYPDGAAAYLNHSLSNPSKGCMATQFLRANDGAELTKSHEIHGDTEYCYDITGYGPEAQVEAYKYTEDRKKVCIFSGPLYKFIDSHTRCIADHVPFRKIDYSWRSGWYNLPMAQLALKNPLGNLIAWKGRFEGSGNWHSCVDDAKHILAAFPELMTDEIKELVS